MCAGVLRRGPGRGMLRCGLHSGNGSRQARLLSLPKLTATMSPASVHLHGYCGTVQRWENDAMCMRLDFRRQLVIAALLGLAVAGGSALGQRYLSGIIWPEPPVITPGEGSGPPSDAIVLFDGKDFDAWKGAKDWKVDPDGAFTVKGVLQTKQAFGDAQYHLEFASPKVVKGKGQGRGNNGVGLMAGTYEIQVLDSFENKTYPEGQCASVYNQRPPMVNASR